MKVKLHIDIEYEIKNWEESESKAISKIKQYIRDSLPQTISIVDKQAVEYYARKKMIDIRDATELTLSEKRDKIFLCRGKHDLLNAVAKELKAKNIVHTLHGEKDRLYPNQISVAQKHYNAAWKIYEKIKRLQNLGTS